MDWLLDGPAKWAFCVLCRMTALHDASGTGQTETAMALVAAGADVHSKDNDGYVQLQACIAGHCAVPSVRSFW